MHMLDPWQLRTFLAAVAAASFRRAAQELALSPSTVTAQIKALEQTVGAQLFARTGNRVTVTEHGRRLAGYARRLLDLEAETRQRLAADCDEPATLTVRLSESLGRVLVPAILPAFRRRFPGLPLTLTTHSRQGLVRDLRQGGVDCGIVLGEPYVAQGVAMTVIHREPLVAVVAPGDGLAGRGRIGPADLAGREVLLTRHVWSNRDRITRALDRAGVAPAAVTESSSLEILLRCAAAGQGVALAPRLAVAEEARAGRLALLAWDDAPLFAAVTVMELAGRVSGAAQCAFLDLVRQQLANDASGLSLP
ncbi:LysR family transcriptional regulator [Desulfovibrio aerotolerans]|uniref:LysR family transcriptional regulator n=2 Tax=Solidesulfovibrio aerotolerans TaxID=295255 RepID=A0A7C9MFL5_9BACT|nr:LysR family transcriptional regulator [Solidesulfovibrio aerotolerans]